MIKKFGKKMLTSLMVLAMVFSAVNQTLVYATNDASFDENKTYAIVDTQTNKALDAAGETLTVTGDVKSSDDENIKYVAKTSLFKIVIRKEKENDIDTVGFKPILKNGNALKSEAAGGSLSFFADYILNGNGDMDFNIIGNDTEGYKITRRSSSAYFKVDGESISLVADIKDASTFKFIEATYEDTESIYIESVKTNGYITFADQVDKGNVKVTDKTETITDNERFVPVFKDNVITLQSKGVTGYSLISSYWGNENGEIAGPFGAETNQIGGWEAIVIEPNGDNTVSLKMNGGDHKEYIVVNDQNELAITDKAKKDLGDEGKFIVHTLNAPSTPSNLVSVENSIEGTQVSITWEASSNSIVSGYEIQRKENNGEIFTTIATVGDTTYTDENLNIGTSYTYRIRAIVGEELTSDYSNELTITTLNGTRPTAPTNITIQEESDNKLKLTWDEVENASEYIIYEAASAYGEYEEVDRVTSTTYEATFTTTDKYTKYYKVSASNEYGSSAKTGDRVSLETELFGKNTLIFAETDDTQTIDKILLDLYEQQHDRAADAQFKADHYQVYFKSGDYINTSCMYLGFYTSFNGLGKTPYDVKLNNIAIPAYLDSNNATCNFWRSAENLSIINTGNDQGKAGYGSWRPDYFNWAVAQAAPLRRVYSERPVAYDWQYGWASGGYVADSLLVGIDGTNNAGAGTYSGQQFYTRNSEIKGDAYGTTLNGFYQGVKAPNLPTTDTEGWSQLEGVKGYSNWNFAVEAKDGNGNLVKNDAGEQVYAQQVVTTINETAQSQEKPFLFIENGEYKVFVPSLRENTSGVSWSEDSMGEGKVVSLDEFYIAKPTDTAKQINSQIEAGKNIYFTPGVYHAEEPINVNKEGTIILGTGMATIIPDNDEAAMKVADVDGVIVSGLIFDAGPNSKYLLKVGDEKTSISHSSHPTLLQDLFFRIGGTTTSVTSADIALEINSNDVLCDHFWIWRADHGTGVTWNSNPATNGLIVNGDNVSCYALFDEHFEEYDVLWNGENGATYFLQNEKCYDPISQETWMSHEGTTNGYAAYKVANHVENHYAVGLGIYNVFINTGEDRDGSVPIQMDNAIEVPNKKNVLIENACIQTFADEKAAIQKFNHIINGVGQGVSSGIDTENNVIGEGWSRKFLISYNNGTAIVGNTISEQIGNETKYGYVKNDNVTTTIKNINALGDDNLDVDGLNKLIEQATGLNKDDYTVESWNVLVDALTAAKNIDDHYLKYAFANTDHTLYVSDENGQSVQETLVAFNTIQKDLDKAIDNLVNIKELKDLYNGHIDKDASKYTDESWTAFDNAMKAAKAILDKEDAKQLEVDMAKATLNAAIKGLVEKTETPVTPDKPNEGDNTTPVSPNKPDGEQNVTPVDPNQSNTDDHVSSTVPSDNVQPSTDKDVSKVNTGDATMIAPYAILGVCALGAYVALKKRKHG